MSPEARKLNVIEKILNVQDETLLIELEHILNSTKHNRAKASIYDFVGIMSKRDSAKIKAVITESCETIDEKEWRSWSITDQSALNS